ncbi:eukaryotic translation initiation factor 4E-like [Uranotaenia lowii]|uniref:eukaryotic translation initiation factor 4E-like n=2 Tax=Uranotaenia lowii TaxID=190385 RepID=UPI00247A15E2|nr:eukaryotic translation initiation factor 4E-like [Uranotaenia lowii]
MSGKTSRQFPPNSQVWLISREKLRRRKKFPVPGFNQRVGVDILELSRFFFTIMAGKTKKEVLQRPEVTERNHADQDGIVDPESCIKHPLQFHWTLWYQEPDKDKSWGGNLNEVATVGAVEDFWKLCNHIKSPSDLKTGGDCSLFKQGIRPMWEDEKNFRGGRWVINVPRQQHHELDK